MNDAQTVTARRTQVPGGVVHKLPEDFRKTLVADRSILDIWTGLTPLARNEFICWIEDAKQATTRERRIRRTQEQLEEDSADRAAGPAASTANAPGAEPVESCEELAKRSCE